MIDQQHPITLSLEMVEQWADMLSSRSDYAVFSLAAQWGWDQRGTINEAQLQERADQELEACCEWLKDPCAADMPSLAKDLQYSRRPKPPSRKKQALLQLDTLNADLVMHGRGCDLSQIRGALEALPE